ncbi:uncharacterized protein LOC110249334 [Exaiptasia diaphana]|uniref:THAP-type domain-containing protein n=1 Tax=Exaiptasia diaphana TaxID=2652724 RepID=A0A913XWV6_EXADI|nr:uncharacterized protein LOC110249334 [Exaiptasia diaphana]KXJ29340.1 THAP domain-containing protein 3 [Exaiptasia diaphana]
MVHCCCVRDCNNNSTVTGLSFHKFPDDPSLAKIWTIKIKRNHPKDSFKVGEHTKVCSEHFLETDFINSFSTKRRLQAEAIPSVFAWSKQVVARPFIKKKRRLEEERELALAEQTETASEGEETLEVESKKNRVSRGIQVDRDTPCLHRFSLETLLEMADTTKKKTDYISHLTGFKSYERFMEVLEFVLPGLDRSKIIYCDTVAASETQIDMSVLFDSDKTTDSSEDSQLVDSENTDDLLETNARDHKLPVEDEFLMFMMKLKLGLTNLDLAIRFYISQGRVSNLVNSWLIYLYTFFGKLKIWPHRDVIIEQMPSKFKEEYPSTMIIIDCTELKIECPSSLLKQSETYSNYKSTNTVKGLVGVDAKGGIMYVSHLYTFPKIPEQRMYINGG